MPSPPLPELPIEAVRPALLEAARRTRRFVLSAPTGSGKSTRVPGMLADLPELAAGQVLVLQPRRIAARLLARRVAQERGSRLGDEVGYQVRFEQARSAATRILFVTEGLFLRQVLAEPRLPGVAAVLFDEFHERHLDTDLALALARETQRRLRPDLVLGVMSATLESGPLAAYLDPAPVVEAGGRLFPVDIRFLGAAEARADRAPWELAAAAFRKLARETEGDVLIFMPGAYEIRRTLEALAETPEGHGCARFALHGDLPPEQQDAALEPCDRRKVIVATNVAETSLTIPGIRVVLDSGLARVPRYDPARGVNTLLVEKISRASADQRAGRAGRTAPGVCLRLWTTEDHLRREAQTAPEVARIDLAEALLSLQVAGQEAEGFPWFEPPSPESLQRARQTLRELHALDAQGRVTEDGRRMARFPLHPRYARFFIEASRRGCLPSAALVAALNDSRPLLLPLNEAAQARRREEWLVDAGTEASDWLVTLKAWQAAAEQGFDLAYCRQWGLHAQVARQALPVVRQLLDLAQGAGLDVNRDEPTPEAFGKAFLAAFPDHVAKRLNAHSLRCALTHGRGGDLERSSVVQEAPLLVAGTVEERVVRGEATVLLGMNTAIEPAWLRELFPEDFEATERVYFDEQTRAVRLERQVRFRDLILERQEAGEPPLDAAARLLADRILKGELVLKTWNAAVDTWVARVNCLARQVPESGIGLIDEAARRFLVEQICHGATRYKDVKDREVMPVLREWLDAGQAALLERWAPERIELPSGLKARLRYEADGSVVLAATVQQLYDVPGKLLRIADGRLPLVIEILAPNRRPVQITKDLDGFWANSYPAVKKDLRGRYPKHEWR